MSAKDVLASVYSDKVLAGEGWETGKKELAEERSAQQQYQQVLQGSNIIFFLLHRFLYFRVVLGSRHR